jgi:hypothetical protein
MLCSVEIQLPTGIYDDAATNRVCKVTMMDFNTSTLMIHVGVEDVGYHEDGRKMRMCRN